MQNINVLNESKGGGKIPKRKLLLGEKKMRDKERKKIGGEPRDERRGDKKWSPELGKKIFQQKGKQTKGREKGTARKEGPKKKKKKGELS